MTWSAQRDKHRADDKTLMGRYCATHHFLVAEGANPDLDPREPVASILVNSGTTGNAVVREVLLWAAAHPEKGPFSLTWYTPSALVPATLRKMREEYPYLASATQVFLFPGRVETQIESVGGEEPAEFVESIDREFTYIFLSTNSIDITTGMTYFHLRDEVRLQRACATRRAAHKFLFFDSTKFKSDGEDGYTIDELLLSTSKSITVYTVSSPKDEWIKYKFTLLCDELLADKRPHPSNQRPPPKEVEEADKKTLELVIVGGNTGELASVVRKGFHKREASQAAPQLLVPDTRQNVVGMS